VDNAAFIGSASGAEAAVNGFLARAHRCGAIVNDEDHTPRTAFDFLGVHYDCTAKTGQLVQKTVGKLRVIGQLLAECGMRKGKTSSRALFALIGTLIFASDVLDVPLWQYPVAMRQYVAVAREAEQRQRWEFPIIISPDALAELVKWTNRCITNDPVHVTRGVAGKSVREASRRVHAYVDASEWGMGLVVVPAGGSKEVGTRMYSIPWTADDHAVMGYRHWSSVISESYALRRAAAILASASCEITLYTDHQPLVAASRCRWIGVEAYRCAIAALREYSLADCVFHVEFVRGSANPADCLSRGRPPLLPVTSVG
jgi:hypothetical protein